MMAAGESSAPLPGSNNLLQAEELRFPMFSKRTRWPLAPNRLSESLEKLRGRRLIDLTESNPTRAGFVYDRDLILSAIASEASLYYEPDPQGPQESRQAVAGYYQERGVSVDPSQIFITSSTSEAYSDVFRLLADAGDSILIPQPSYPLFDFLARLDDVETVAYPLVYHQGWEIDPLGLEIRLRGTPRAVLVVNPNNPTGSYLSRQDLNFLSGICRQHQMALVADEVFLDYGLELPVGHAPRSLAGETEVLTFTLSGLSKVAALPQMKLAWIVVNGPEQLIQTAINRLQVIVDTYLSVSTPVALALPKLLETRSLMQPQIQERIRGNLQRLDTMLAPSLPVSRLRAEGGWYAILRLPAIKTDEDWAILLLEQDLVFTHPGHFYDFPSDGYLVVSLLPEPQTFEEGIRRVLARIESCV
jgi:alanine-synthesizing transaminase